jgi:DNA mismatch repair protein MutS
MTIFNYYLKEHSKYTELYGKKTIILLQVGSFFEIYATLECGPDIHHVASLLDVQCTKKNKSITEISENNHLLVGFPTHSCDKFVEILVNNQFTVVLIEQTTPPPNPKREVTKIISPSTFLEHKNHTNNYLMSIYFSTGSFQRKQYLVASISWVDVRTNESFIYETVEFDSILNIEDVQKTIANINPKELIIFTDIGVKSNETFMKLLDEFSGSFLSNDICIQNKLHHLILEDFFKLSYQNVIFSKIFKNTGILSVIEYLDLERKPLSAINYAFLLQFIYDHNTKIIEGIQKPSFIENEKNMTIVNNALFNLNLLSNDQKKYSSITNMLNNCKTPMGKRYFIQSIINPLTSIEKIIERYDLCDFFIQDDLCDKVRVILCKIQDIDYFFKKISIKTLQPPELKNLYNSLESTYSLFTLIKTTTSLFHWSTEKQKSLNDLLNYIGKSYNFEEMEKVNTSQITKNIFKKGKYENLDILTEKIETYENYFETLCLYLNENNKTNEFKMEKNKDNVKTITITKHRFQQILNDEERKKKINSLLVTLDLTFDSLQHQPLSANNKTIVKITFKNMYENQVKLNDLQNELRQQTIKLYYDDLVYINDTYHQIFYDLSKYVANIDFYSNNAINAIKYCYTRPTIVKNHSGYVKAKSIRHPLIEQLQTDIPYITNDIELGTEEEKGILLYGINSVGKSSLMKSVGICVILAQCGMFVSCKSFEFSPYDCIISRLPSGDNIFKHQSTFMVEMNEVRTILKRANEKCLILGDEIASGTETISGISIIASAISYLSKKKSSFIFATHWHELYKMECVQNLNNVNIFHLSVHYDNKTNTLLFDRILKKGPCESLYGLEIIRSLDMPSEFLSFANEIRNTYMDKKFIVEPKSSVYNQKVFLDICSICKVEKTDEVHHIVEQHLANKKGIVEKEQIHKNRKSNLINVCAKCHDQIHRKEIIIDGHIQSDKGIQLQIKKNINLDLENEIEIKVLGLRNQGKSQRAILEELKPLYKITQSKVKSIIDKNKNF